MKIKVDYAASGASSVSNYMTVIEMAGDCFGVPNNVAYSPFLLTAWNTPWTFVADAVNLGALDCSNIELVIEEGSTVNLESYDNGDTDYTNDYGVVWSVGSLNISSGATITADSKGYWGLFGQDGIGPGAGTYNSAGGYGGYGQTGGAGSGGSPYGDVHEPDDLGSSGAGARVNHPGYGGSGGGAIKIDVADTITIDGTISANGGNGSGTTPGGAGSGGSIWIDTQTLNGSGLITANGGTTLFSGGGGRIAIYYETNSGFPINFDNNLQSRGTNGGPGTIYLEQKVKGDPATKSDTLYVDNNNVNGRQAGLVEGTYTFDTIHMTRYGDLDILGSGSVLNISSGTGLQGDATVPDLTVYGTFNGPTSLIIEGVDVGLRGAHTGLTGTMTIGTVSLVGGLTLYEHTWAHNLLVDHFVFGDTVVSEGSTLTFAFGSTPGDYGQPAIFEFGAMTIKNGAVVTVDNYVDSDTDYTEDYGVEIQATSMDLQTGATITADSKGYRGVSNGAGVGPGAPAFGSTTNGGASHGGYGQDGSVIETGPIYGDAYEPTDLGSSGGGRVVNHSARGGDGGGAVKINVDTSLNIDGTITAGGSGGLSNSGSGSGGSIWIDTQTLSGSGLVKANGGTVNRRGGGGRIAIYYETNSGFPINFDNNLQSRGTNGGPGTIYLEQKVKGDPATKSDTLYVDNNNVNGRQAGLVEGTYTFDTIHMTRYGDLDILGSGSVLNISSGTGLQGDATVPDLTVYGTFNGPTSLIIEGVDVGLRGAHTGLTGTMTIGTVSLVGGLTLYEHTWAHNLLVDHFVFGDTVVSEGSTLTFAFGSTPGDYGQPAIFEFGAMTIKNGAVVTVDNYVDSDTDYTEDYGVEIQATSMDLQTGATITADSKGYRGVSNGAGVGPGAPAFGSTTNGGASHGGYGQDGSVIETGPIYGDAYEPTDLGSSGGGRVVNHSARGGDGGGAVKINVDTSLNIDGTITAGGSGGLSNSGSGSGGSIWIDTQTLSGSGLVKANGGTVNRRGGGGRIAIYYETNSGFPINFDNNLQSRGTNGGPGTIYLEQKVKGDPATKSDTLYVDNNNVNGRQAGLVEGTYTFDTIHMTRYGDLDILGSGSVLNISSGTGLQGDATVPDLTVYGTFNGPTSLIIEGVDVGLRGAHTGLTGTMTIGTVSLVGGLTLYEHTWAHNLLVDHFVFGDTVVSEGSTLTFAFGSTPGDYGQPAIFEFGAMTIKNGAVVTVDNYVDSDTDYTEDYGVEIQATSMDLQTGATITADSKGYRGVSNGAGVGPGAPAFGSTTNGGASHGGYGQDGSVIETGPIYGDAYEPTDLGSSGGGRVVNHSARGGDGGGAVKINVDTSLNIDGTITAGGSGGLSNSGSGSGGSIWIDTQTLSGSGLVKANGGTVNRRGGGGRIAIYYETNSGFPINFDNNLQSRGTNGGPGTIYLEQKVKGDPATKSDTLYVDNNNVNGRQAGLVEGTYTFDTIHMTRYGDLDILGSGSVLNISSGTGLQGDATVPDLTVYGTFNGPTSLIIEGVDVGLRGAHTGLTGTMTIGTVSLVGGLTLYEHTWAHNLLVDHFVFGDTVVSEGSTLTFAFGSTPGDYGQPAIFEFGAMTIKNGAVVTVDNYVDSDTDYTEDYGVEIQATSMDLQTGATITADSKGYRGVSNGAGVGPGAPAFGSTTNGGASHGGYGQDGSVIETGPIYGDAYEPTDLGSSGGGRVVNHSARGGDGGGAVKINVDTSLNIDGTITAGGSGGLSNSGSGSGGSIWIDTQTLSGSGLVKANGGTVNRHGGGGRIAIYSVTSTFDALNSAHVQAYGALGGPGTIYYQNDEDHPTNGSLLISNNANGGYTEEFYPIDHDFHHLILRNYVKVNVLGDTSTNRGPEFDLTGDFELGATSNLFGNARGYATQLGPGVGETGLGSSGGAGAGHGGQGGDGQSDGINPSAQGGAAYDAQREPVNLGSGGGRGGTGAAGGTGGGAISIHARTGELSIAGTINVNGSPGLIASPGGGGGAGGSIWLTGETCDITGSLLANGGNGGDDTTFDGGGGGGGRIALWTTGDPALCSSGIAGATISVAEGTSSSGQDGQIGTFVGPLSIPQVPATRNQYRTDGSTEIPVGGYTDEDTVVLEASLDDLGAAPASPKYLEAQFEVRKVGESYTGTPTHSVVYGSAYTGGDPVLVQTPSSGAGAVSGLEKGGEYKWRVRARNTVDNVYSDWIEFGGNGTDEADFIRSVTDSLLIDLGGNTTVNIGEALTATVSALDEFGDIAPSYTGTITFTSSATLVVLPANYTFTGSDAGIHIFTNGVIFNQAGVFTLTVTDVNAPNLTDSITVTVIGPSTDDEDEDDSDDDDEDEDDDIDCTQTPTAPECLVDVQITNVREIIHVDNQGATICWDTNIETVGYIDYGEYDIGVYTNATGVESEYKELDHCLDIEDLTEETAYLYRITATAPAGQFDTYEDVFALGIEEPELKPAAECIVVGQYSTNANNQILIPYETAGLGVCSLYYGTNPSNLPFTSSSGEMLLRHIGVIELSNLSGIGDIIYRIQCSVALTEPAEGEDQIYSQCATSGVIPRPTSTDDDTTGPSLIEKIGSLKLKFPWWSLLIPFLLTILINYLVYPRWRLYALPWLKERGRRRIWGVVYDKKTKTVIPFAAVRLYRGREFLKEIITDTGGKYGFIADKGEYEIVVEHPEYGQFVAQYTLEQDEGIVALDLGIAKSDILTNLNEEPYERFRDKLRRHLKAINTVLVIIGFTVSLIATIVSPGIYNFAITFFYLFQFVLLVYISKRYIRNWGYTYDTKDNARLGGVFIRLYNDLINTQLDVQITDEAGRYGFRVEEGAYLIKANAPGYTFPIKDEKDIYTTNTGDKFVKLLVDKGKAIDKKVGLDPMNYE
jgi:hypothetical protein